MNSKGKNNFLITGVSSGLGKYLHDNFGGISFDRKNKEEVDEAEVIIHCAFNRNRDITTQNLYQYLFDNIFLTKKLAKIPHKKFIFISSVDVYPKNDQKHFENEVINVNQVSGIYEITKLFSESLIQTLCPNLLILRCAALLGKDSKENSLIKIIREDNPTLTVSADSIFNFILHTDVLEFIKKAIENDLQGIYNLASSKNITLKQVADLVKKKVTFGDYVYNVGNIDNSKTRSVTPAFKKTSEEIIVEFSQLIV